MDTIFSLGDIESDNIKINLDDLYEKKKIQDLNALAIFNKILNRIHLRIKTVSRQQKLEQHCWYIIPEMIIGVPKYDNNECIAYIINKLKENGFVVRYTHPNMLFISWKHWVPSYVRQEIKKKTGLVIDGYGNEIIKNDNEQSTDVDLNDSNNLILHRDPLIEPKNNKDYKSIDSYKPSGNLIYNQDLLKKIESKSSRK
jgi:hypothetical protein